ncbi:shufflon system plasmid conjugative transfer pilus tip adhesin PilV [Salinicola endophyticus]|uniref:Shufflon system plasmid conjugative transfer pilus tip adhesin PilV n=1 Tax=Salinicola endophyticus TaxID=1949083 RepID=A0AB74UGY5_9GAMM
MVMEAIVVLAIMAAMSPIFIQFQQRATDARDAQVVGAELKRVAEGSQRYIQDNLALLQQRTKSGPVTISHDMLVRSGYLDASSPAKNSYNQSYAIKVIRDGGGNDNLRALVTTTGGQTLPYSVMRSAAQESGAAGGVIADDDTRKARSVSGSWEETLSRYQLDPGGGHLASVMLFTRGALDPNYLYRVPVPGRPDLNEMRADLDMTDHDIKEADKISAKQFVTAGNSGWYAQKWGGGWHMSDHDWIRATGNKGVVTGGTVQGGYLLASTTQNPGAGCEPNGLIGRQSDGSLLSCVSGKWSKVGGAGFGHWRHPGRYQRGGNSYYAETAPSDGIVMVIGQSSGSEAWVQRGGKSNVQMGPYAKNPPGTDRNAIRFVGAEVDGQCTSTRSGGHSDGACDSSRAGNSGTVTFGVRKGDWYFVTHGSDVWFLPLGA